MNGLLTISRLGMNMAIFRDDGSFAMRPENQVDHITEALASQFPRHQTGTVEALVRAEFGRRSKAPVQEFVPIFVERALRAKLATR
jgi:hypothetical protein